MTDRRYSLDELQDRAAIADLYDRQLAAAEAWDFDTYDTTFTPDATLDLTDVGLEPCRYPEYREWLAGLQPVMVAAHRVSGGLRLHLDGDRATTTVSLISSVTMQLGDERSRLSLGMTYHDELVRTPDGWRIATRRETVAWSTPSW